MSNIYNLEPPTKGKVILHTNLGDLEIELWPKEAPKACRNFVQLCAEGYYDGTIFHRVIKDYIAQGGDPTGTGNGGESIYGEPFKDEFHSRLRFTRRGLVACANQNEPHTNGSQFFITLDKADWLNNRNTIFGRIVGDTVYNMLRFNDLPVDGDDRPLEPPVIREAEVVWNPFDDLAPRVDREARRAEQKAASAAVEAKKRAAGRTKNLALLSFGDEAEAEEEEAAQAAADAARRAKIRSAHDVLEDERLARERAIEEEELRRINAERPAKRPRQAADGGGAGDALARAKAAVEQAAGRAARAGGEPQDGPGEADDDDDDDAGAAAAAKASSDAFAASMRAKVAAARVQAGDEPKAKPERARARSGSRDRRDGEGGSDDGSEDEREGSGRRDGGRDGEGGSGRGGGGRDFVAERRAELEAMRQDANKTYGRVKATTEVADADLLKPWQLSRERYKARKRAVGDREKDTLARLSKFTAALRTAPQPAPAPAPADTPSDAAALSREATTRKQETSPEPEHQRQQGPDGGNDNGNDNGSGKGYAGRVRSDLDHRSYMPAAWRVDDYLEDEPGGGGDGDGGGGDSLAELRAHRFEAAKDRKDAMARDMDNLDDYVVFDPLLESKKGKWSAANQREQKRQKEWAGRANM